MRLAARDCAGEAVVEFDLEATVEATRERALRDIVLWLSRACLRRSRIVFRALEYKTGIVWVFVCVYVGLWVCGRFYQHSIAWEAELRVQLLQR
jgi:hypothetical protein